MICENCGKKHNGEYSNRFCSLKCARAFSTKSDNKKELKKVKCITCGKTIYINKRASSKTCECDECKHDKICPVCGQKMIDGKCNNKFCKKHNFQHFKSLIKYFGFDKNKLKTLEVEDEFIRVRNLLYDLYWNKNLSSADIARLFNYNSSSSNIIHLFECVLEIPIKTKKYATTENYLENRLEIKNNSNKFYKSCWHTTWNNKEVYLRSTYELDFAKELDEKKIDYDVECLRIKYFDTQKNEYHCAIPDFYLPETNTVVEIKSNWTLDIQNMKDKFKAYKELKYNAVLICDHKEKQINLGV